VPFDNTTLSRYAPVAIFVALLGAGWMLLVQPRVAANARAAKEIDSLREQVVTLRTSMANPLPPAPPIDPVASFEQLVPEGDATSALLEQLARVAAASRVSNLLIETADPVAVATSGASGPQVVGGAAPDPRFALFAAPLTYSPVTMSFDAGYARAGEVLWRLRDLATTVEIRSFEARPVVNEVNSGSTATPKIHVSLTLFAYARQDAAAVAGGAGVLR
jgi:hypothetical protein